MTGAEPSWETGTLTRVIAAAVGLAVILPAALFGGPIAVQMLVPLVAIVGIAEYASMAFPAERVAAGVALGAGWFAIHAASVYGGPGQLAGAWGLTAVGALVYATFVDRGTLDGAADRAGRLILGVGWLSLLSYLVLLRRFEHGIGWVFLVLAASWLGDTGAYFSGRFFGRHPLYPRVSPKKTWEGVAGGITLATVGTFVIGAVALPNLSVWEGVVLGPGLCIIGVVGDLAESMLKRSFSVKDSGWIMPGHGGLLDRIDSVMFVAPSLYVWVLWMEGG